MFRIMHLIRKYARHCRLPVAGGLTAANRLFKVYVSSCFVFFALTSGLSAQNPSSPPQPASSEVWLADLEGPVSPASADHIRRTLNRAADAEIALLVLRINTPGGLDTSMRDIVSAILESPVPVATWVAPSGARAASAGTYIVAASHVAAMSPATNIGSSTPVSMGGNDNESAAGQKAVNDAIAYLQGLQTLRGRNTDWAARTVADAANLTANEALEQGIIDLIAGDTGALLQAANGRSVETNAGNRNIRLDGANVTLIETGWRHNFLSVITNPNIAYILLMIGIYGLILEFYNPGLGLPGITGIICLLVGAYALQMLPISYAGLALMAVGIGLIVFEVLSPSFGVFGLGGLTAFVLGSVMLMDTDAPAWQISLPLIAAVAVASGALIFLVLGAALKARQQPIVTGNEAMARMTAVAMEDFEHQGHVHVSGETWTAKTNTPVKKGDRLRINQIDGLLLHVAKEDRD
ncbi:MAG: nodulation protein NfeD [Pseudohongiella sp.]|uniref:nodulation protein NfeD n=1 Tax=Pseudohongiella sp. TaxID=1979412 RepID=UPI0034A04340